MTDWQYQAKCIEVVDGDTADFDIDLSSLPRLADLTKYPVVASQIDLGFCVNVSTKWAIALSSRSDEIWLRQERIRFYGINCPELHAANPIPGQRARDFTKSAIEGKTVTIQTYRVKTRTRQEKYGRYLGSIFLENGQNLNELLVQKGLAVPFMVDL